MTLKDPQFRAREIALLRERIANGTAGANDISRWSINGRTGAEIQAEQQSNADAAKKQAGTILGRGIGLNAGNSLGIKGMINQAQINQVQESELAARVDAYISIVQSEGIDSESKKELFQMYQSGAVSTEIASNLKKAQDGEGIYGIRKINNAQRDAAKNIGTQNTRRGIL